MDDYEDLELPVYRYQNASSDQEDGFEIPSDHEDTQHTAKFQDLLGFDPIEETKPVTLDDVPIKAVGKTFEQLVEEQMRAERATQATQRKVTQKREFLRKNSGGLKAKPLAAEKHQPQAEIEAEDQDFPTNSKPKQTFLKRGEGKICAKTVPEPSPVPRPVPKSSVPAKVPSKAVPVLPTKPVPAKSEARKASPAPVHTAQTEDEIEICREELVLTETVAAIKPRLKEKPLPQEPLTGIQAKMQELLTNLEKIKAENRVETAKLSEKERQLSQISSELDAWQSNKTARQQSLSLWKEEELRKLKAERKAMDSKAPPPAKKENEELEDLRRAVSALQEELNSKENKRKSALEALKSKVTSVSTENRILETELKELERRRVSEGWTRRKDCKPRFRPYQAY